MCSTYNCSKYIMMPTTLYVHSDVSSTLALTPNIELLIQTKNRTQQEHDNGILITLDLTSENVAWLWINLSVLCSQIIFISTKCGCPSNTVLQIISLNEKVTIIPHPKGICNVTADPYLCCYFNKTTVSTSLLIEQLLEHKWSQHLSV